MNDVKQWRCPDYDVAEIKTRREEILALLGQRLEEGVGGLAMTGELSQMLDGLLQGVRDGLAKAGVPEPEVAVFATGSYGQNLSCPRSDLDLLVVYGDGEDPARLATWCGAFQTALQDAGLKVGMAHRTPSQCLQLIREDVTIAAAMLPARILWGGGHLRDMPWPAETLKERVAEGLRVSDGGMGFAAQIRAGCRERHARYGRTVYLLEPEIKYGRGGLRDFQAMMWSAAVLHGAHTIQSAAVVAGARPEEAEALREAVDLLFRVRVALHLAGGRFGNDRLIFEHQERIARLFGYQPVAEGGPLAVERFMKTFYRAAETVARLSLQWQDIWLLPPSDEAPVSLERGLCVRQGRVDLVRRTDRLEHRGPVTLAEAQIGLFGESQVGPDLKSLSEEARALLRTNPVEVYESSMDLGLPLHPVAEAHLARAALLLDDVGPDWGLSLRRVLCAQQGAGALTRSLFRSGILPRVLPEFGPVMGLGKHDVYHVLTVDAHLIQALEGGRAVLRGGWRDDKPGGRFFSELADRMPAHRRDVFLLGCLLHDVGKGRGGDHSNIGADLAAPIGPRLRLTAQQTAHLQLLIREHLLFPKVSQRRDLQDPEVIQDVARRVRTLGALDDLTLLAAVDMDAVGPQNLTQWKVGLLIELHGRTRRVLEGGIEGLAQGLARGEIRRRLEAALGADLVDREAVDLFAREAPLSALRGATPEGLARQFEVFRATEEVGVGFYMGEGDSATEVVVCTKDRDAVLATIAGVISAAGLNILSAQINPGPGGVALDVLAVQTSRGGAAISERRRAALARDLRRALTGEIEVADLIKTRRESGLGARAAPDVPTKVKVDHVASSRYTIIEVVARDGVGLLWTIARCLYEAGCTIHIAKILTEGERAIDTFYLEARATGQKLSHDEAEEVRQRLLTALG